MKEKESVDFLQGKIVGLEGRIEELEAELAPPKPRHYELLFQDPETDEFEFMGKVREYIEIGWQPLGGPFLLNDELCQAVVK